MGYESDFIGQIDITPPMRAEDSERLNTWLDQRHVIIDGQDAMDKDPDWQNNLVVGNTMAENGWNYIHGWTMELFHDDGMPYGIYVVDHNEHPFPCPSLWSDLIINDGTEIFGQNGKAYSMDKWIPLVCAILTSWGYDTNGCIVRFGEYEDDVVSYVVTNGRCDIVNYPHLKMAASSNNG